MHLLYIAVVATTLVALSYGATKTKCEVVKALRAQGVQNGDLRDWLCLVQHESSFRYDVMNTNSNGSKDHGLFQFDSRYWCKGKDGYRGKTCWRLNRYGCKDKCDTFEDSDISNDANCAVRMNNCHGCHPCRLHRDNRCISTILSNRTI